MKKNFFFFPEARGPYYGIPIGVSLKINFSPTSSSSSSSLARALGKYIIKPAHDEASSAQPAKLDFVRKKKRIAPAKMHH